MKRQRNTLLNTVVATIAVAGFTSISYAESKAYLHGHNLPSSGVALEGYCPVAYFAVDKAVRGNPEHASTYNGVTYHFVSADAKKVFDANPKQYLPAYGGWCALGMAVEDKFPVDPTHFKIVNGRLMLFLKNKDVDALKLWNEGDEQNLIRKADAYWKKVSPTDEQSSAAHEPYPTLAKTVKIDGLNIFYREAGAQDAPTVLLLHGFPTSSHMFRNLIPALSARYHVIAPDYPGYGRSSMPAVDEFDYSFDHVSEIVEKFTERLGLKKYSLYVMDYGAPVGFRLAVKHPERVQALIVQNGNAYMEGLDNDFWAPIKEYWKDRGAVNRGLDNPFWSNVKQAIGETSPRNQDALRFLLTLGATKWQYMNGTRNPEAISPDNWRVDQALLDRPGNQKIQLQMFYDYGSNPPLYPQWQEYFRTHQPPTLIVWGKNDEIFPAAGAHPYKRDLKTVELHLLDTGHFALEEDGDEIANQMRRFLDTHVR